MRSVLPVRHCLNRRTACLPSGTAPSEWHSKVQCPSASSLRNHLPLGACGKHPQIARCLLALADAVCVLDCNIHFDVANSLGTFAALTTCSLLSSLSDLNTDLTPLQTLETLRHLQILEGVYTNVNAAYHSTRIHIHHAQVMSSPLVDLQLPECGSIEICARGGCACTALKSLAVSYGWAIDSEDRSDFLTTSLELL